MKKKTKPTYSNCYFSVFYLLLRSRVKELVVLKGNSVIWPHHYVIVSKNDRILDFSRILPHDPSDTPPFWFLGHYKIHKKRTIRREVLFVLDKLWIIGIIVTSMYILLFIPWMFFWCFHIWKWCWKWAKEARKKN